MKKIYAELDYETASSANQYDFQPKYYNKVKKYADKSEIIKETHSPFPSIFTPGLRRKAVFYFKSNEKMQEFIDKLEELANDEKIHYQSAFFNWDKTSQS